MSENIEKWVAALRSGDYRQGFGGLHVNGKFCCLGVACDLYAKEHDVRWEINDFTPTNGLAFLNRSDVLPPAVADWLGTTANPTLEEDESGTSDDTHATDANDVRLWDFNKIADAIERIYL